MPDVLSPLVSLMNQGTDILYRNSPLQQGLQRSEIQARLGQAGLAEAETGRAAAETQKIQQDMNTQRMIQSQITGGTGNQALGTATTSGQPMGTNAPLGSIDTQIANFDRLSGIYASVGQPENAKRYQDMKKDLLMGELDKFKDAFKVDPALGVKMWNDGYFGRTSGQMSLPEGQEGPVVQNGKEIGNIVRLPNGEYKFSRKAKETEGLDSTQRMVKGMIEEDLKRQGITREATMGEIAQGVIAIKAQEKIDSPQREAQVVRETGEKKGATEAATKTNLSEASLTNEGLKYLITGQITMGFGGKEDREAIMNKKNQIMAENGLTEADALTIQSSFDSDKKNLANLQKQAGMTNQAVRQAGNNAQALLKASDNFGRTNYPAPNKLVTWLGTQAGTPQQQAEIGQFKVALLAFSREYMRVVTGAARSVAELSIRAQDTADQVIAKFDSWSTLKAKLAQAQTEMNNTSKSYNDELKATQMRLNNPMEYVKQVKEQAKGGETQAVEPRKPGETIGEYLKRTGG